MPEEITEPVVEAGEVEPEPFTLPEDFASQVQSWDIPVEQLPEAVQLLKSLQTEDGVIEHFIASGQKLGFGLKDLNRLFEDEVPAAPAPAPAPVPQEQLDPERLMTAAEVEAMLNAQREELQQFRQQQEQTVAQERARQAATTIDGWFDSHEVAKDENTRKAIAGYAEKHVLPGQDSYDPRVIAAALERGKAEYDAWIEHEAQAYLARKSKTAQQQPTPVGGGQTHAGGSEEPPVDYAKLGSGALEAAKQRVRDRLRQAGELN